MAFDIWQIRRMALSPEVIGLAAQHGGMVSRTMLLEAGVSRHWIDREVRAGRLRVIKPGFYRVLVLDGHIHLLRAAVLTLPNAVVSHQSAAYLLRFPRLPALVPTVTVRARTTHTFPGVTVRRTDDMKSQHLVNVEGLRSTNIMRTLFDLAGILDEAAVEGMIEALVIDGRLQLPLFADFSRSISRKGKRGSLATSSILERRMNNSGVSPTTLEREGMAVIRASGLPEPHIEYPAPWNGRERIDIAWPRSQLGVEWDSRTWHARAEDMSNDRRRDREAALAGWVILRYTWDDVTKRPTFIVDEVASLLRSRTPS